MNINDIAEKYAVEAVNKSDIEASWIGFLKTIIARACKEVRHDSLTEAAAICKNRRDGNEIISATYLAGESYDCQKAIEAKRDAAEPANDALLKTREL